MNRKQISKIAGFLTAFALIGSGTALPASPAFLAPIMAGAEDSYTYESNDDFSYRKYADHIVITQCDHTASEIVIPAEIDGLPVTEVTSSAFFDPEVAGGYANYVLESLTIPDTVTEICFPSCRALTSITIDGENSPFCVADNVLFTKDMQTLVQYPAGLPAESYTIPDSVTTIGHNAFDQAVHLTNMVIPESVTAIETSAFYGCEALTGITLPESLTTLGTWVFGRCYALTSIVIPEGITALPDSTFMFCSSLQNVTLPDTLTSIGECAFNYNYALAEITIPETVTAIGEGAFGLTALQEIVIPKAVETIGDHAFYECMELKAIQVDPDNADYQSVDGVLYDKSMTTLLHFPANSPLTEYTVPASVTAIESHAAKDNLHLTKITIPQTVTFIGTYAFSRCTALTELVLLAQTDTILNYTFYYCEQLQTITLTDAITTVELRAFGGCAEETTVYYTGTEEQWNAITFEHTNEALTEATVYFGQAVPAVVSLGDLDGNAVINAVDAAVLLQAAASVGAGGESGLSAEAEAFADLNADGAFDASDAALILQYAAYAGTGGTLTIEEFLAAE